MYKKTENIIPLEPGKFYHIYNKSVGRDKLFISDKDYFYFFKKTERFILPIIKLYAYCLMANHFHFLVKINEEEEILSNLTDQANLTGRTRPVRLNIDHKFINQQFSNFFNSYTKSFNQAHNRTGKLFNLPYKRIFVDSEEYFRILVCYIHQNPVHHGFSNDFTEWKYSSYKLIISEESSYIDKEFVLEIFGGMKDFLSFHGKDIDLNNLKNYTLE